MVPSVGTLPTAAGEAELDEFGVEEELGDGRKGKMAS